MKTESKDNNNSIPISASKNAEESLVASLLLSPSSINAVKSMLVSEDFFYKQHRILYQAMAELSEDYDTYDIVTLTEYLTRKKQLEDVGGQFALINLFTNTPTASNVMLYARIVKEHSFRRYVQNSLVQMKKRVDNPANDIFDEMTQIENDISRIYKSNILNTSIFSPEELSEQIYQLVLNIKEGTREGIMTGFIELDMAIGQMHPGDSIIIGARPSVGKSRLLLSILYNTSILGNTPAGLISLEMPAFTLLTDMMSYYSNLPISHNLRRGIVKQNELDSIRNFLQIYSNKRLIVDDTPNIDISTLKYKCTTMVEVYGVKLIGIDYMQLLRTRAGRSQEEEVAIISNTIKGLAKELDIPIITLTQLNRASETEADREPKLHQLRYSGAIEQDADVVIMIHRPEFYGQRKFADGSDATGKAQLIVRKCRHGEPAKCIINFNKTIARFTQPTMDGHINHPYNEKNNSPGF